MTISHLEIVVRFENILFLYVLPNDFIRYVALHLKQIVSMVFLQGFQERTLGIKGIDRQ